MTTTPRWTPRTGRRTEDLFREQQQRNFRRMDRMFAWLMVAQWLCGLVFALWSTPYTWSAGQRLLHPNVLAAALLGGVLTSLPIALVIHSPGRARTRHVVAIAQMMWSALLIHVTGGRLETHFHVFGSLAFIAFYRDWRVLPGAVLTVFTDHLVRGVLWPESIYGIVHPEWWRFLEHGAWVAFEAVFLILASRASERERWQWAEGQAEIEQLSAKLDEQRTILACQSDASLEGVLVVSAGGEALSCNRRFKDIWGLPPGEFQRDLSALRSAALRNVVEPQQFFDRVLEVYDQPERELTDLLQFNDGRVIERYTAPVRSEAGGYIGRGWYFRDVTERVRADAAVRVLNAELEQRTAALAVANGELEQRVRELRQTQDQLFLADRLSSLGRVAAGIGHEINNPLTYVLGNLKEISRQELSPDVREMVGEAIEGSERVRRIVGGLKSISRATPEVREPVDLHATLESTLRMVSNEIRHRGRLIRDFGPVPLIEGDPSRMAQVFLNLIVNATQALTGKREGGHFVSVRTFTRPTGEAVVEIEDSGEGIPPERIPRLFDPFFTTKAVGVGTGLGLSICDGIVSAHGGTIEVDSVCGAGSRFRVVLPPLRGVAAVEPRPAPVRRESQVGDRRSLLLVDDDSRLLRSVKRSLDREYDVETCEGGAPALALLATGRRFDIILCDLHMPGLTGMDFHRHVSEAFPGLERTIIFMTGGAFTPEATAFALDCSNPSIEKPVDFAELDRLVRQVHEATRGTLPAAAAPDLAMLAQQAPPASK
jgi:signal transduction histidine kinase/ActR/RegA family two-component response regulator